MTPLSRRLFALCGLALSLSSVSILPAHSAPEGSLLIRGGLLLDGTGKPARRADVRISGGRITAVGSLKAVRGETIIEAKGRVVAPGFIDTHSHTDGGLLESPTAESQIRQGITTAIVGQDGGSNFPLAAWFGTVAAKKVALNIASFVGHGTMRAKVMGDDNKRAATSAEIAKMEALVDQEMRAGALGLSSGLEYDPGLYATTDEVVSLARVAGRYGGLYISHVRDEENEALTSFRELIRIAREAKLPAQISHIKLGSSPVWAKAGEVQRLLASARREGLDITADVYPYTYWQSTITVIIPHRNWDDRKAWETGLAEIGGPGNVLLTTYSLDPTWQGKTIAQIATLTGKDAVTVIQEIVAKTHGEGVGVQNGRESVVVTAMKEADLKRFIADPTIMFCTDGGIRSSHPRGAGSFPRILGKYVREEHVIPLPEAIRKMTSLPAKRMGLRDRGTVAVGKKADLVIFDPRQVRDTATTKDPRSAPIGLADVVVNGVPVLRGGRITGARPGEILRRS
ncbi:MAG: D-aminoacylase [Armatimonadota bacterium]